MTGCAAVTLTPFAVGKSVWAPCDKPAVAVVTVGCVHEHLIVDETCQWHLDNVRRLGGYCGDCATGDQPHAFCPVRYLGHTPLDGDTT